MNVYFAASTGNINRDKELFLSIIKILKKLKHNVQESWLSEKLSGKVSSLTSQEILLKNIQLLQESDLAVFELTTPSFGVGYFIGQALANHKKILCLYPESIDKNQISEIVSGSTSSLLSHTAYNIDNLEQKIRDFIAGYHIDNLRKFNFIATDEILKYIEVGSGKEGKSKSEFLRDKILNEIMNK